MRRVETEIAGVSGNYDRFSMARHISRHADNKVTTQAGVNVMRGGRGRVHGWAGRLVLLCHW